MEVIDLKQHDEWSYKFGRTCNELALLISNAPPFMRVTYNLDLRFGKVKNEVYKGVEFPLISKSEDFDEMKKVGIVTSLNIEDRIE